jgi:hypothetical protein
LSDADVVPIVEPLRFRDVVELMIWLEQEGYAPERVRIYRSGVDGFYTVRVRMDRLGGEEVIKSRRER